MSAHRMARLGLVLALCVFAMAPVADAGPGIVDETVDGNTLEATVRILGVDLAEVRFEFEDVDGLEVGALGLSAETLDLFELIALILRLPHSILTSIPSALPMLLHVDPDSGLSFAGTVHVTIETDLLPYVSGTNLRLFYAEGLGDFEDVTSDTGAGSYRGGAVRPDVGTGSYVIASDARSDQTISENKLDRLDALLDAHSGSIDSVVLADLESRMAVVRAAFEEEETADAITALDGFAAAVVAASGEDIPDVWQAESTAANVAGELRSQAATLRFSLVELDGG